jgi:hypothetical protein
VHRKPRTQSPGAIAPRAPANPAGIRAALRVLGIRRIGPSHPPRTDAVAGPIAFIGLNGDSQLAPRQLRAHGGKYNAVKVLAVLKQGWQVTVTVPGSERGSAALLYNPDAFSPGPPYPFSAGDPVVTFPNCGGTQSSWGAGTQFNGGLLVRRPMCVHLDITAVHGSARLTRQIAAPLGRGASCP